MNPNYAYGDIHQEVADLLQNDEDIMSQLVLLPRGHLKSHLMACYVAWEIVKDPCITVIYLSATQDLCWDQLGAIKNILESDRCRDLWPDLIDAEESKRAAWNKNEIRVDHPSRRKAKIRDATVKTRSVGSNFTGLHCDLLVLDDLMVPSNSYTAEGRQKVRAAYSQANSVLNPGGRKKAAGTRYHPDDIYAGWLEAQVEVYNNEGMVIDTRQAWTYVEYVVEADGYFLWPRTEKDGKWYGFDHSTLAQIRSDYFSSGEKTQYYAQYYNDPNDPDSDRVVGDFQYYDRKQLTYDGGVWYYMGRQLSVYAAMDCAYTTNKDSDWTALAVIGVDTEWNVFLLELSQIKTDKYAEYYKLIAKQHRKWHIKKAKIETNSGANLIAEYVRQALREEGLFLSLICENVNKNKVERIEQILEPRYESDAVWHYRGGWMNQYEEQIVLARPKHDDLKDAVAAAVEIAKPPSRSRANRKKKSHTQIAGKFGGYRKG
jgi:phage terminase large subunit-like protein